MSDGRHRTPCHRRHRTGPRRVSPPSVTDRRPVPPGVLPRRVQTWIMAGIAIGMLAIMLIVGRPQPPARTAPPLTASAGTERRPCSRLPGAAARAGGAGAPGGPGCCSGAGRTRQQCCTNSRRALHPATRCWPTGSVGSTTAFRQQRRAEPPARGRAARGGSRGSDRRRAARVRGGGGSVDRRDR